MTLGASSALIYACVTDKTRPARPVQTPGLEISKRSPLSKGTVTHRGPCWPQRYLAEHKAVEAGHALLGPCPQGNLRDSRRSSCLFPCVPCGCIGEVGIEVTSDKRV